MDHDRNENLTCYFLTAAKYPKATFAHHKRRRKILNLASFKKKEIYSMQDKTESISPETSEPVLPFFARFLEGQDTLKNSFQTLKYPSDRDEDDFNTRD